MNEKIRRLLTPEGVRDLLPGLAGQKRAVENRIQDVFRRFGYREVATPAFEYAANFEEGLSDGLEEKMYRFSDERGRTLVLRPDFTLPLARLAATHLSGEPKPLRLCYGGNIYRYAPGRQGRQREMAQAGVELIGAGGAGGDAEVVALAAAVLDELGLSCFTLCVGHVGFLQALLDAYEVKGAAAERIKHCFSRRDFVSLKEMVGSLPLPAAAKESLLLVPALRGGQEIFGEAESLVPEGRAQAVLASLKEILEALFDFGVASFVTLDLGLVRAMDYYTGMVFEGFTSGLGFPICGGGRYDRLLGHFGPELPAVGFALNIDHLLTVLQRQKKLPPQPPVVFAAYSEEGRWEAVSKARELRAQGAIVITDTRARDAAGARLEAQRHGAAQLLYFTGNGCDQAIFALKEAEQC